MVLVTFANKKLGHRFYTRRAMMTATTGGVPKASFGRTGDGNLPGYYSDRIQY